LGLKDSAQGIIDTTLKRFGYVKGASLSDLFGHNLGLILGRSKLGSQREQLRAYLDWVYGAANTVAKDSATIDFRAYVNRSNVKSSRIAKRMVHYPHVVRDMLKRDGQQPALEELDNHILLDLLDHPNPFMTPQYFYEMTYLHLQLAGESFWGVIRNGLGKPAELWPMVPYNMREVPGKTTNQFITGWLYRVGAEDIPWDFEDVVHIKLPDPNNFFRGMSIVRAAARAIDTDSHSADWNRNFIQNSARPDMILETDKVLSNETFARLKAEWADKHGGTENAGKTAILENGLKAHLLTMSHRDMDFLEGRKFNRDQILALHGVSRVMMGLIEGDGRSNMEAAEYNHAKRTIKPMMARVTGAVNHQLAPEYDKKLVIGFTDPVPDDKEFAHKERIERLNKSHTINEIRKEMGDGPIPGGDVIYQPLNLVPLGVKPEEPEDDEDDEQVGQGAGLKKKAFTIRMKRVRKSAIS
jgi:HK97 family phage portal protein